MNKIDTVKGIGPKTAGNLIKSGIETISDLLTYYPYRFEIFARSNIKELIDECLTDERYSEGRQAAKNETWANPGKGAEIVADYLISKYEELSDKEENAK